MKTRETSQRLRSCIPACHLTKMAVFRTLGPSCLVLVFIAIATGINGLSSFTYIYSEL